MTKHKYPSRYSPGKSVTEIQYIVELICEKRAQSLKRDLPIKFWELPEWAQYFKSQLRRCKFLLSKYNPDAIIKALKDKRAYSIYSLHAKWLIPIIEKYNKQVLENNKNMENAKIVNIPEEITTREHFKPLNIIDKLGEIDG